MSQRMFEEFAQRKDMIIDQIYVVIQFGINVLFSLATVKLITTKLEPDHYGLYRYVLAVVSLCSIATIKGFDKSLMGYVAKDCHGTVKEATKLSLKIGAIGVLILIVFGLFSLKYEGNAITGILFLCAAVVFLPFTVFQRYQSILSGLQKFKVGLVLRSISVTTQFAVLIIVLFVLNQGVLVFGISYMIVQAILYSIFFTFSIKLLSIDTVDQGYLKHSFNLSVILLGIHIISPGLEMYLNYSMGPATLAYFVVAKRLSDQATSMTKSIVRPISVRLTKKGEVGHSIALMKVMPWALLFGVVLYVCFIIAVNVFGSYVVARQYNVCLLYTKILGLTIVISPLLSLLYSNVVFEKNNRAYAISTYGQFIFRFIGYVCLVPSFSILGVIVTNVATSVLNVFILMFYVKRGVSPTMRIKDQHHITGEEIACVDKLYGHSLP